MKIIFDNIVFSLQKTGGISVVWYEIIKRIILEESISCLFIDYKQGKENYFRRLLKIPKDKIINNFHLFLIIRKYLNPIISLNEKTIFHSSYYRTCNSKNAINITTVHDFTYEYYRNGVAKYLHHIQKYNAIKKSKLIICVSFNTKVDLLKFHPNINEENIRVIHNGVDNNYRPLLKSDLVLSKLLIPFSIGEFVLYIGDRKSIYKNFNIVVKACKIAQMPLVMVGGNSLSNKEVVFLINELGNNNFKHIRSISNDQLNMIYNMAFCLLYPSLYEGFGIPIIEAQRAGCPVISTNYSSIPEVAGKGAILLEVVTEYQIAEMLFLLKNDSAIVKNLVDEGFKNSQRFSWAKCYQETKQLYKEVYEECF